MTRHYRKVALACVLIFAAVAATDGAAQAQGWPSYGPSMGTWTGPGGSRCFAGTWNGGGAYGAYNGRFQMQAQFCYGGAYPQAFSGPWPGAYPSYPAYPMGPGAYPAYPAGPGPNRFYPGYGPQPFPYAYPSWAPRPFGY